MRLEDHKTTKRQVFSFEETQSHVHRDGVSSVEEQRKNGGRTEEERRKNGGRTEEE